MVKGATAKEISSSCPIECEKSTNTIITQISSKVYVVTHPPKNSTISCGEKTDIILREKLDIGAYKIAIPCTCRLKLGTSSFYSLYPCKSDNTKVKVNRIIPAAWTSITSLELPPYDNHNFASCTNLSECLSIEKITITKDSMGNHSAFTYVLYASSVALVLSFITFSYVFCQLSGIIRKRYFPSVEKPKEGVCKDSSEIQVKDCKPPVKFIRPPEIRPPIAPPISQIPKVTLPAVYQNIDYDEVIERCDYLEMRDVGVN
jgi:hypothetical protein